MPEAMWRSVTSHIQDIHDGRSELCPEFLIAHWMRISETRSGCSLVSEIIMFMYFFLFFFFGFADLASKVCEKSN